MEPVVDLVILAFAALLSLATAGLLRLCERV
jgi:hypothetical protein